jgi:zinc D-Ala-D-Ala carboxypeptidase
MGDLSTHFSSSEFRCHHCGRLPQRPPQRLLDGLEVVRQNLGGPVKIVSGYRCPIHNREVGGASDSRHVHGDAADLQPGVLTIADAKTIGFVGIGHCRGWVVHVDVRPGPQRVFVDC